jgi:hypothetical protein
MDRLAVSIYVKVKQVVTLLPLEARSAEMMR